MHSYSVVGVPELGCRTGGGSHLGSLQMLLRFAMGHELQVTSQNRSPSHSPEPVGRLSPWETSHSLKPVSRLSPWETCIYRASPRVSGTGSLVVSDL